MQRYKLENWARKACLEPPVSGLWQPLLLPTLLAALSAALLLFRPISSGSPNGKASDVKKPPRAAAFGRLKLASCLALLVLSTIEPREIILHGSKRFAFREPDCGLILTYIYVSLLASISLYASPPVCDSASRHSNFILAFTLSVYLVRDILPLGKFSGAPQDSLDGVLLIKIGLLGLAGLVIPLLTPRRYYPVDASNPMTTPNPEQTASILSLASYTFLDPTIFLAQRLGRLPYELLPPLADYDSAPYLRSQNFQHIQQNRHLFFGLIRVFRFDIFVLATTSAVLVFGKFVVPVGVNQLLRYIETKGEGATVRPWVWVLWLFLGPTIRLLAEQWYMFTVSRAAVRLEILLTQLVFEHALKMKINSGTAMTGPGKGRNLLGRLNNMITTDIRTIIAGKSLILSLVHMPLQLCLSVWFLYATLGWSAFVGMVTVFAMLPIPGYVGVWVQTAQRDWARRRDARVLAVTETVNLLRMIKLFGWERKMSAEVAGKRHIELTGLWKRKVLDLINGCINIAIPIATMTVIMQQDLTTSKIFSSMTVFNMFKVSVQSILSSWTQFITSKVSLDRVDDFLHNTELLRIYSSEKAVLVPPDNQDDIGFHHAIFSWSNEPVESTSDSSARGFTLEIDDLVFQKASINLILGPTGCGKTSLLLSLLGETNYTPSSPGSWYNLPRRDGVAYVAQESWVQSDTIKANIVFGADFDADRYKKVLYQCCLERDLELLAAGDEQVVGERGLTLSGGQKARVTLARALYSQANILLLDDIFASLDVHTSKWIVDKCFRGDLIAGRTVLLVTHNIALTRSISQFAVSVGVDGRLVSQEFVGDALEKDVDLSSEVSDDQTRIRSAEKQVEQGISVAKASAASGKLIVPEEIVEGNVGWSPVRLYLGCLGGNHPHIFFLSLLVGLILRNTAGNFQTWYLGYWSSQYNTRSILLLVFIFYAFGFLLYTSGVLRASEALHHQLIDSVLGTTLRWLDTTPTSRIIARSTQDMGMVDGPIATALWALADQTVSMAVTFGAIVLFTPVFFGPGALLFILGTYFGRLFMPARISVKREMSNTRAPVLGHFGAAVAGLVSIRAYECQEAFIKESLRRLDRYTRTGRLSFDLTRWSSVRTGMLSNLFTVSLAIYLVYFQHHSAANTGFSLNTAVNFGSTIASWIFLERIEAYINVEQEPKPTKDGVPPATWPRSGHLVVENLSARYSEGGPNVLHGISFTIKSGERIGSSLTLALLRAIVTEGFVSYDGIATRSLNLDALRSKITIIPQIPELLSGKLRQNLDPFHQFEDSELTNALRSAGLFSLQAENGNITLDTMISSGGGNLSVGQRQIIALARAMVRQSKLIILDEDYETDAVIQSSLRDRLGDVTVIIVAHRLQTIMDADRIMVLDAGRIVEFDSPKKLLEIEDGHFRSLIDESEDRDALHGLLHEGHGERP
ncbi:P-loop containing nucleoside triphosphate hydrolase protein [Mycena galericulata]|nr:P-loop containing nucleoside triphosphate hydrolase protein [Mycena galericulata]